MTEEIQANNTPETQPTIDDVHAEFSQSMQTQTAQTTPAPQTQQNTAMPNPTVSMPDPTLETEKFQEFIGQNQSALQQSLSSVKAELDQFKAEKTNAETTKAISAAVDTIGDGIDGVDKDVIEAHLIAQYNKNPKLAQIWDNRDVNPVALDKALSVLNQEMRSKFAIKQDPQLTENQRAINEATNATTQVHTEANPNKKLLEANVSDFDQEWEKLKYG